jgi:hypothetical protein
LVFISLSDFIGSIGCSFGYPEEGTMLCSAQGFLYLYFFPASWIWTTILVYQLRTLIIKKELKLSLLSMHCLGWLIPLIPSVLPLTDLQYGQDDMNNLISPCTFRQDNGLTYFVKYYWLVSCDAGLGVLCALIMTYWTVETYRYCSKAGGVGVGGGGDGAVGERDRERERR